MVLRLENAQAATVTTDAFQLENATCVGLSWGLQKGVISFLHLPFVMQTLQ